MLYQGGALRKKESKSAVNIETDMYLWGPDGTILKDSKNKELKTTEYHPFTKKSYTITNPATKGGKKFITTTDSKTKKETKYMCVGYRLTKTLDKESGGDQIVLASSMIELHKGASGDYLPYFTEEKDGTTTKTDKAKDSSGVDDTISLPAKINDRHVTVKRFNSYKKTKNGKCESSNTNWKNGKKITVEKWNDEITKVLNWCNSKAWGIRNEDGDRVKKITVQWYYAPIEDEESQVVLEQYYTPENEDIKTTENPSVDDSRDLEYSHSNTKIPQKVRTKQLATVEEGEAWVSYKVEQTAEKAYKLKKYSW